MPIGKDFMLPSLPAATVFMIFDQLVFLGSMLVKSLITHSGFL